MMKLGLNIDHVATLRQARGARYPNVVRAALRAYAAMTTSADKGAVRDVTQIERK